MRFEALSIAGAMLVRADPRADERGSLSRLFSRREFAEAGLMSSFTQESAVHSHRAGTLRGFHFQAAPAEEAKLVSCLRGGAFDVILDVRPSSPTFGRWQAVTLRDDEFAGVYVPPGCAHAVQTLCDDTVMLYRMSCDYDPQAARGFRWDSPEVGVRWPLPDPVLSERDRALPEFRTHDGGL